VYFRDSYRRLALQHGVTGWVRNLPDGRVEAVLEGPPDEVHRLVDWAHRGPAAAAVTGVAVREERPEGTTTAARTVNCSWLCELEGVGAPAGHPPCDCLEGI